jgi:hypothetical protein
MNKLALVLLAFASISAVHAQEKKKNNSTILNRASDHIMIQLGTVIWTNTPDSISNRIKGFARSANVYVMTDKVFKKDNRFSVAFGLGVSTSNVYFKNFKVDITASNTKLPFVNLDSANRFKKYKLTTAFLELPLEFRFTAKPNSPAKSIKAAVGVKIGTAINVHTKGKSLQNKENRNINNSTLKETDRDFFNSTRLSVAGRVGFGNYSLFASYQINNLLKDGAGPAIKPLQVGICISGL